MTALDLGYRPRDQFVPFHRRTQRFAILVCHRRAGKTVASVYDLQDAALRCQRERPRFAYVAPLYRQAKAVAWDYLKAAADPLRPLGATSNETELKVDYHNGGQVRLYGAENPDTLRGLYLDGIVLDEYADMDPRMWSEVIRPALADREGWAVFIGTPKGHNSFYHLWSRAKEEGWFTLMLKASETGLVPEAELDLARKDLTDEQYAQEFECSFEAAIVGAYYGKQMTDAERFGRIVGVPWDPCADVWTAWDLGIRDSTAIWFAQMVGKEVHLIDYYEATGADLNHYVQKIKSKPYTYAGHIVPHDAQARELGTGKSRLELLRSLGLSNVTIAPKHRVEDGIAGVRVFLPRCWFDKDKCLRGIEALKIYRSQVDEKLVDPHGRPMLKPQPLHDWASHAADSFRYLTMTFDQRVSKKSFSRVLEYPRVGIA